MSSDTTPNRWATSSSKFSFLDISIHRAEASLSDTLWLWSQQNCQGADLLPGDYLPGHNAGLLTWGQFATQETAGNIWEPFGGYTSGRSATDVYWGKAGDAAGHAATHVCPHASKNHFVRAEAERPWNRVSLFMLLSHLVQSVFKMYRNVLRWLLHVDLLTGHCSSNSRFTAQVRYVIGNQKCRHRNSF